MQRGAYPVHDAGCASCERAVGIARNLAAKVPSLSLTVVNLATATTAPPDLVVATPTYVLEDRVVSLGNPRAEDLEAIVRRALAGRERAP